MIVPFVDRIVYVSSAVQPAPYPLKMFIVAFAILRGAHNLGRHHGRVIAELRALNKRPARLGQRATLKKTRSAPRWLNIGTVQPSPKLFFSSMLLALGALTSGLLFCCARRSPAHWRALKLSRRSEFRSRQLLTYHPSWSIHKHLQPCWAVSETP